MLNPNRCFTFLVSAQNLLNQTHTIMFKFIALHLRDWWSAEEDCPPRNLKLLKMNRLIEHCKDIKREEPINHECLQDGEDQNLKIENRPPGRNQKRENFLEG